MGQYERDLKLNFIYVYTAVSMEASINEQHMQIFINKNMNIVKTNKKVKKNMNSNSSLNSISKLYLEEVSIETTPRPNKKKKNSRKKIYKKEEDKADLTEQQLPDLSLDEIEASADLLCKELFSEMQIEDMTDLEAEKYMDDNSGDQFKEYQLPILEEDGDWEPYYLDTREQLKVLTDVEIENYMDEISGDQFKEEQIDLFEDFRPCNDEIDIIFWDSDDE